MSGDKIILDDEAERFFKELGGIDTDLSSRFLNRSFQMNERLDEEEQALDVWYILIVDLVRIIGSILTDARLLEGTASDNQIFGEFMTVMKKLSRRPIHDNRVLIRYRGAPKAYTEMGRTDYQVLFADMSVDTERVINIVKRRGPEMKHLYPTIKQVFDIFSNNRINSLYLRLPYGDKPDEADIFFVCLQILSRYEAARKTNTPIYFLNKMGRRLCSIMFNEMNRSDLNLTLLAGLNELKPESVHNMVEKVNKWINQSPAHITAANSIDVYSALFRFKNFKDKLIRPPIEVNNANWLIHQPGFKKASKESIQVSRLVVDFFADSPQKAARVLSSVYGDDFNTIEPEDLGERLGLASDLLDVIEHKSESLELEQEIVDNIEMRLDVVNDAVYENIFIDGPVLKVNIGGKKKTLSEKINEKISKLLLFFKNRLAVKNKIRSMRYGGINFSLQDYETLARDFNISVQAVKELIKILKECFDDDGSFRRAAFEHNIPEFARYEKKVFEFLLHYLKETVNSNDRFAFLNSLQLLIAELNQPKKAMGILLDDFLREPKSISYADRNSIMLANLLLRTYNKELNLDIEITPEEVLLVKNGLNQTMVSFSAGILDRNRVNFYEKIRTIHKHLIVTMDTHQEKDTAFPVRYLFSLEREIYIFLSLVGGPLATGVIRSALKEYGSPDSDVYTLSESRNNMLNILQLLKVLIRGMEESAIWRTFL